MPKPQRNQKKFIKNADRPAFAFPPAWQWFIDEAVPQLVKNDYSPRESWKGKPFTKEDAQFFFKGIAELSDLFTDERPNNLPAYFTHPKYRSAYLLYFLPLQAAKFLTLFDQQPDAIEATLAHGRKQGVMRIVDLGAGPGTASIALLLHLLHKIKSAQDIPPIELIWLDTNDAVMQDGKKLVEHLSRNFPKFKDKITTLTYEAPWWKLPQFLPESQEPSLILMGNVLNEARARVSRESGEALLPINPKIVDIRRGGGMLMLEPAFKSAGQMLSNIRDFLIAERHLDAKPGSLGIWGPCLHAGHCPLREGRDWCHFSVLATATSGWGKWFEIFSRKFGSERSWVKYSYLWLASLDKPAPAAPNDLRRVVSDPIRPAGAGKTASAIVLLCEPEAVRRHPMPRSRPLWRGETIRMSGR